ncbi:MAG: alpha/beta hydrolase [Polyangiaceae bacterium]|nr:alpha/beta hydrolase [Polyangiaceae bacterium]
MLPQTELAQETSQSVTIAAHPVTLRGDLILPRAAHGVVLFAHGSGSSRHSPRNRAVAAALRANARVGTLLIDLLSTEEESVDASTRAFRFDIELLARRLEHAIQWLEANGSTRSLGIGVFGASTGAAAALVAAARRPDAVRAVVSRGGRPDLAGEALTAVQAPTLLIVGGRDHPVLELNQGARKLLAGLSKLEVVPGATHLFEEPGTLDEVSRLAGAWFARYLKVTPAP